MDSELIILPAAVLIGLTLGIWNYRLRLRRARGILDAWAVREQLRLLVAKPRHVFCGPFGFRGSKAQQVFWIRASDRHGTLRTGYALCGGIGMGLMSEAVKIKWEG